MLISSQLTLIKRCQQQGEKRYLLSKINNDSARRQSVSTMLKVRVCWPESLFDHIPWAQVPPPCMHSPYDHYHSSHSSHAHQPKACAMYYSLCTPSASPPAPSVPAIPTAVSATLGSGNHKQRPPAFDIFTVHSVSHSCHIHQNCHDCTPYTNCWVSRRACHSRASLY